MQHEVDCAPRENLCPFGGRGGIHLPSSPFAVNTYIQVKMYVDLRIQNKVILGNVEVLESCEVKGLFGAYSNSSHIKILKILPYNI